LRAKDVPTALATECNPGSSTVTSLVLTMNMTCTLLRMTPEEALSGATGNAARALGLRDCCMIVPGLGADLAIRDIVHPEELSDHIRFNPPHAHIFRGAKCKP
jgi:imidazolonepropionase